MKKTVALLLCLVLLLSLCGSGLAFASGTEQAEEESYVYEDVFADWNEDAPALNALIEYVEAVTDESSPDFIPVEDRLAVFDMDGTLYGELFPTYLEYYMLAWRILKDPSITPDTQMLALGRELRESVISHSFASDMPIRHAIQAARAYAGLTLQEFADFVNGILVRDVDGFEGMTYATAFYTPMLEVIEYLQDNDFKVFVCSGSDRFICRVLLEGMIDIPYENIIGMDVAYEATGQGDTDGLDYVFQAGDEVVRTDQLIIKNLKMNKVLQIVQDIGRKPVLSFGNSSGDVSMHMYTISSNPYRSAAFMLIANDEERDYGNAEKAEKLGKEWEADGFHVISMRDDFRTIYGDDVVKTGTFRWAEELAEDRIPSDAEPVEDGQNPVMNFIGVYHCDGARLLVEAEGAENARITVVWDNNGENARWFMSGRFDPEELSVYYQDCVKSVCIYHEGDEAAAEEDVYFNGHGFFFFDYEHNSITWQDDQEHAADGMVFQWGDLVPSDAEPGRG